MADPFTPTFIAANCAWALIQNRTDAAAVGMARRLAKKLSNRSDRRAQDILQATHKAFVESLQAIAAACTHSAGNPEEFFVAKELTTFATSREVTELPGGGENVLPSHADDHVQRLFRTAHPERAASDSIVNYIEVALRRALPASFRTLIKEGSADHLSWSRSFELLFSEQVKRREGLFRTLIHSRVNEIIAVADRGEGLLEELHAKIESFNQEFRSRFNAVDSKLGNISSGIQELLVRVSHQEANAPLPLLRSLAAAFGDEHPKAGATELEAFLRRKINDYHQLSERISALQHEDNHDAALLGAANEAISNGNFSAADGILDNAECLLDERVDRLLFRKAERRTLRAAAANLAGDYAAAVAHYDAAASMVPEAEVDQRFNVSCAGAAAAYEWGLRSVGASQRADAVHRWRQVLRQVSRAAHPDRWAFAQTNLGSALVESGSRQADAAALREARAAFDAALQVYSRQHRPLEWASLQSNLAGVLTAIGERENNRPLLHEAVAAYRDAIAVLGANGPNFDWAVAQGNLGAALRKIGEVEQAGGTLQLAVSAFQAQLQFFTRAEAPRFWGMAQCNLANVYMTMAIRQSDGNTFAAAVEAYHKSLLSFTEEDEPLIWAFVQNNLGIAWQNIGAREADVATLHASVSAFNAALRVRTRQDAPYEWAMTLNNLATVLKSIGDLTDDLESFFGAKHALESALTIRTREAMPSLWAMTTANLANIVGSIGHKTADTGYLNRAVSLLEEVLSVYSSESELISWANTVENLGLALLELGSHTRSRLTLIRSVQEFERAVEAFEHPELAARQAKARIGLEAAQAAMNQL